MLCILHTKRLTIITGHFVFILLLFVNVRYGLILFANISISEQLSRSVIWLFPFYHDFFCAVASFYADSIYIFHTLRVFFCVFFKAVKLNS